MLTAEQLAERHTLLGSSDVAAIVGLNKYTDPQQIWGEKVGLLEREIKNQDAIDYGNIMEPVILDHYANKFGVNVEHNSDTAKHPQLPWAAATIDGYVTNGDSRWIVEAKTANWRVADRWGATGTDEVPEEYLVQVQWQMFITGLDRADIHVSIAPEFRTYTVIRNDDLITKLLLAAQKFWQEHVETEVPPEINGSQGSHNLLTAMNPRKNDDVIKASEDDIVSLERLKKAQALNKRIAALESELKAKLCKRIGSKWKMTHPLGSFSWGKESKVPTTDWEAIAKEMRPSDELLSRHTKTYTKNRVARPHWSKSK